MEQQQNTLHHNFSQYTQTDQEIIKYVQKNLEDTRNYFFPLGELPHPHIEAVLGGNYKEFVFNKVKNSQTKFDTLIDFLHRKKVFADAKEFIQDQPYDDLHSPAAQILKYLVGKMLYSNENLNSLELFAKKVVSARDFENNYGYGVEIVRNLYAQYAKNQPIKLVKLFGLAETNTQLLQYLQELLSVVREAAIKYDQNEQPTLTVAASTRKLDFLTMSEKVSFTSCFRLNGEYCEATALCMQNPTALVFFEPDDTCFRDFSEPVAIKKQRVNVFFSDDFKTAWIGETKPANNPFFLDCVKKILEAEFGIDTYFATNFPALTPIDLQFSSAYYLDIDNEEISKYDEETDEYEIDCSADPGLTWEKGQLVGDKSRYNTIKLLFNPKIKHFVI